MLLSVVRWPLAAAAIGTGQRAMAASFMPTRKNTRGQPTSQTRSEAMQVSGQGSRDATSPHPLAPLLNFGGGRAARFKKATSPPDGERLTYTSIAPLPRARESKAIGSAISYLEGGSVDGVGRGGGGGGGAGGSCSASQPVKRLAGVHFTPNLPDESPKAAKTLVRRRRRQAHEAWPCRARTLHLSFGAPCPLSAGCRSYPSTALSPLISVYLERRFSVRRASSVLD